MMGSKYGALLVLLNIVWNTCADDAVGVFRVDVTNEALAIALPLRWGVRFYVRRIRW